MKPPMFDPPYESPIEELFAWNVVKYLDSSVDFEKQVSVRTICGEFRLDFLAQYEGKRVAFECDGREYHDLNRKGRDEWRDAMILGGNAADVIYRLRGTDLMYHTEDLLFMVSKLDPELFPGRSQLILRKLASQEARSYDTSDDAIRILVPYRDKQIGVDPAYTFLEREPRVPPKPGQRLFWRHLYEFARNYGGGSLDAIKQAYWEEIVT